MQTLQTTRLQISQNIILNNKDMVKRILAPDYNFWRSLKY